MIQLSKVCKCFGDVVILRDVDISINRGSIHGIIGRSGVGKSTILRCINGLEPYDSGSITVDGVQVGDFSEKTGRAFRKNIGMIFQQFSLLERLTVYDNIALPLRCWKYEKQHIDEKVRTLASLVELSDKLHAYPRELSGGQKQRVAIARALSLDPKILLSDEATSALDPKTTKSIAALLRDINKKLGITIVVVSHQMSVLRYMCEEITILQDGQVAEQGPIEQLFSVHSEALQDLLGQSEMVFPYDGINIKVLLSKETWGQPVMSEMARTLQVDFIILGGTMERYRDNTMSSIVFNCRAEDQADILCFLDEKKVRWNILHQPKGAVESGEVDGRV